MEALEARLGSHRTGSTFKETRAEGAGVGGDGGG